MAGRLNAWAGAIWLPGVGRLGAVGLRSRRLGLAAASTFAGKFVNLVVQMVQVPLLVSAMGIDLYGEAVATVAFLGVLAGFDLGFGAAVKNAVAELVGRRETAALPSVVIKAAAWSGLVSAVAGGILLLAPGCYAPLPGSGAILRMLDADTATRWLAVALVVTAIPLTTATQCVEGLQLTWLVNACRMAAAFTGLGVTVEMASAISQRWQLVTLLSAVPVLGGVGTCLVLWQHLPRSRSGPRDTVSLVRLVRDGMPFMLPIVASLLVTNAPQLAILAADGSSAVTRYVVGQRMMAVFIQPLTFVMAPLWPAFVEARASGDGDWVARQVRRASWAAVAYCSTVTLIAVACGRWVAAAWVGRPDAIPTVDEMTAIAVAAGMAAVVQPGSMLLNAYRRFQLATTVAVLQIGLAFAYEPLARVAGPASVPAAQGLFGLLVIVPAVVVESRAALRR